MKGYPGRQQCGAVLVKVLLFSLGLTLVFTLVANLLPQVEGEAPVEQEIDLGAMTMDSFVSLGEGIFSSKGTCTLCHNSMGRAPDILQLNMAATANERLADDRYKGETDTIEGYLRESMLEPSLFVVKGFGQKGSNDTVSPMPAVNKAPILLSDIEIDAVIAFMQAKDGNEVTVALPQGLPEPAQEDSTASSVEVQAAPAETAEEALGKYACMACHSVAGSQSSVGPDLSTVGSRLTSDEIRESILQPNDVVAEGYSAGMMPTDFAGRITVGEFDMLVAFLVNQKGDR